MLREAVSSGEMLNSGTHNVRPLWKCRSSLGQSASTFQRKSNGAATGAWAGM